MTFVTSFGHYAVRCCGQYSRALVPRSHCRSCAPGFDPVGYFTYPASIRSATLLAGFDPVGYFTYRPREGGRSGKQVDIDLHGWRGGGSCRPCKCKCFFAADEKHVPVSQVRILESLIR